MTRSETQITKIITDDYGVGIIVAPTEAILWAAEQCGNPQKALSVVNKQRMNYGAPVAHTPYGHPAF